MLISGLTLNGGTFGGTVSGQPAGPSVGQAFGGGYYAGLISVTGNGVATHYLIVSPKSTGEAYGKKWKTTRTATPGTTSPIDGPTNSANMNNADHPAAEFCEGLTIGGFSDWYMPAENELEVCYYNLKPTTETNNNGGFGANPNSVPSRNGIYYTLAVPGQTSATDFQTGNSQPFAPGFYWSSTQYDGFSPYAQTFSNGTQYYLFYKDRTDIYVRAVRRVPV